MEFFGLDIGSHTLKAVQLAKKGNNLYQLLSFGSAPSTDKGLLSEAESDLNNLAEQIKKLHAEAKIKTRNVATALPQDQVFTRVATFPKLSEEELDSALKWEAEQYIPVPLEEVNLVHQIVGQFKDKNQEKIEVLLAAAPVRLIEKTTKVLKAAGLTPVGLESEIMAIARSLVPSSPQTVMVVDLGAKATDLAVVEKGLVIFVHSIPSAGEALTRAVAQELGLETSQAEAYKRAYGLDLEKLEGKIGNAIGPVLQTIISEVEKTIQYCSAKQKNLSRIILCGGTAGLPEVGSLFAKKLNLEIQIGNPFSQTTEDGLVPKIPKTDLPLYATAVGLAMKEIEL